MSTPTTSTGPTPPSGTSNPVPLRSWFKAIIDWIAALSPAGADKYDTGWVNVALAGGFTATNPVQVRRIGPVIYWRGRVTRDAGNFATTSTAIVPAGGVPVWARPTSSFSDTTSPVISVSGVPAVATVDTAGALTLAVSASVGAAASVFLKGLSGYTVN